MFRKRKSILPWSEIVTQFLGRLDRSRLTIPTVLIMLKGNVIRGYDAGSVCLQSVMLSYNEKFPRPLSGVNDLEF